MKNRLLLIWILTIVSFNIFAQSHKAPNNLRQAIKSLQIESPDSLKSKVKNTSNDKLINLCYPWGGANFKTLYNWLRDENSETKLSEYLSKRGVADLQHQQTVLMVAFKESLEDALSNEKKLLLPYQSIENKWRAEDKVRYVTDSLRGYYVPKDLNDCFQHLDKLFTDSTKMQIRKMDEKAFLGRVHLGLGTQLRNNWGLWSGSRLSKYFNELGIQFAEDMSSVIFDSYHRYLLGKPIRLGQQIQLYKDYWIKARADDLRNKKSDFSEYKIGDTLKYKYHNGYVSQEQESKADKEQCIAKGIIFEKNEDNFFLKVFVIDACDLRGIVYYNSKNSFVFNKRSKKWKKLKKHVIKKIKVQHSAWFSYADWQEGD